MQYLAKHKPQNPTSTMEMWKIREQAKMQAEEVVLNQIAVSYTHLVAIPCVAPIALGGFYSFNGMNFYEYMGKKLHFMFGNRALTYVSTEGEPAIKQLEAEQNEQVKNCLLYTSRCV